MESDFFKVISLLTLDEKVAQLCSLSASKIIDSNGHFDLNAAKKHLKYGIGQITRLAAISGLSSAGVRALEEEIQSYLRTETRFGIPSIIREECNGGFMAAGSTLFPQMINQASTWNRSLIESSAKCIGFELNQANIDLVMSPTLDIVRDPRWGRVEETCGEDPVLTLAVCLSFIQGVREGANHRISFCAKHFIGHGWPEGGRNHSSFRVGSREFYDVFCLPFQALFTLSDIDAVMAAYNEIDGIPIHASKSILQTLLRGKLGFNGVVLSDYKGINYLKEHHNLIHSEKRAVYMAFKAGVDVEIPDGELYKKYLKELILEGEISEEELDKRVERVLILKDKLSLDNKRESLTDKICIEDKLEQLTEESLILLKNSNNVLPLTKLSGKTIALIGPYVDSYRELLGLYSYPIHSNTVTCKELPTVYTILRGCSQNGRFTLLKEKGCRANSSDPQMLQRAIEVAKKAEIIITVMGISSGFSDENLCGEMKDMSDPSFPKSQKELLNELSQINRPIIGVLLNGRSLALGSIVDKFTALIEAWLPGEKGAEKIIDLIMGKFSPSGKLPISLLRSPGQIPLYYNHYPSSDRSMISGSYVDEECSPLFAFGHGLSFSKFKLSDLKVEGVEWPEAPIVISFFIENIGGMEAKVVPQLYTTQSDVSVLRPVKELKGFIKLSLTPQERRKITFYLEADQLAFTGEDMKFSVEPGVLRVMIGLSSNDIRLVDELPLNSYKEIKQRKSFISEVEIE